MKKKFALVFGLALTLGFSQDANAWWWKSETQKCTVTETFSLIGWEWSESYEGTRTKCIDGDEWCLSQRCS